MTIQNDYITAHATAEAMIDMFLHVSNWNKLDRDGVVKNLRKIQKAIKPGYKKQMGRF